jgi:hypothetical protein
MRLAMTLAMANTAISALRIVNTSGSRRSARLLASHADGYGVSDIPLPSACLDAPVPAQG